jgi:acyl dehydratase
MEVPRLLMSVPSLLVGERDIAQYAAWSRDRNPLHVDPAFARRSYFGGVIAHGMLSTSSLPARCGRMFTIESSPGIPPTACALSCLLPMARC